ncbi:glutamine amidotransferase-related protein [Halotalea alkalilenta]|uniref:CTP synthase (glutamine hydrolyzing) n=1 Tax=Halotalea alkalilenta TaxID=376489 RepID=A0A172YIA2_9GAMM|nr:gamma-glutamyl-gamma-aminobutyrate hydrolase family protein [Halotalea alkalilenta]ANF58862.1 hypothetical protein A5892_16465 [Halotalea alkalilenta]
MHDLAAILHPPGRFELAARAAALWLAREECGRQVARLAGLGANAAVEPGARQFVTADGRLVDNGWLWLERASVRTIEAAEQVFHSDSSALLLGEYSQAALIASSGETKRIARVEPLGDRWRLVDEAGRLLLGGSRDRYDRPCPAEEAGQGMDRMPIRVALIGERDHLREVYPANQAALGDAADHLGVTVEVRIVSPLGLERADARSLLGEVDALVLPGGCDGRQIEGQILLAGLALALQVPTLGLCFGMQSMATAVIRDRLGHLEAVLEELDPEAPVHSFIALRDQRGAQRHRLGAATSRLRPGSRVANFHAAHTIGERMNHRYRLAPRWRHSLETAGISISAWSTDDPGITDAIEARGEAFFVGIQGHPELSSSARHPHPGFIALLEAALARR